LSVGSGVMDPNDRPGADGCVLHSREDCLFYASLERWWEYRRALIRRHSSWVQARSGADLEAKVLHTIALKALPAGPRGHGGRVPALCIGTRWWPTKEDPAAVLITCGGIYAGLDGPAGLFDRLAEEFPHSKEAVAVLQLDAGHEPMVAEAVLQEAIDWVCDQFPSVRAKNGTSGGVILAGFSMGATTIARAVHAHYSDCVSGIMLFSGQTLDCDKLQTFSAGLRRVLVVHGMEDVVVSVVAARHLSRSAAEAPGQPRVDIAIIPQKRLEDMDGLERQMRHHCWEEREEVYEVVVPWVHGLVAQLKCEQLRVLGGHSEMAAAV